MEHRMPTGSKIHFNATISDRNYVINGIKFIKSFIDKNYAKIITAKAGISILLRRNDAALPRTN